MIGGPCLRRHGLIFEINTGLFGIILHRGMSLSQLTLGAGGQAPTPWYQVKPPKLDSAEVGMCAWIGIVVKENVRTESSIPGIFATGKRMVRDEVEHDQRC